MGYSAPDVLAADEVQGFALLEDFGDGSFSVLLTSPAAPSLERTLYEAATDFLVDLHRQPAATPVCAVMTRTGCSTMRDSS